MAPWQNSTEGIYASLGVCITTRIAVFIYVFTCLKAWGGAFDVGSITQYVGAATAMVSNIFALTDLIGVLETNTAYLDKTFEFLDIPNAMYQGSLTTEKRSDRRYEVEFKDVSFKYPDGNEMVLEHFDLKVPQGTNVAIVGETGAGKSTLVNLVCRFFEPTYGQVLIDGKDARDRSQLWLHSNIGYVLQTPHLFSGTVRDNLRYGKPDATDEEIWKALKLVNAEFVIDKMDKGLDSEVGEGGDMLSTGEKQLISFARAILADPKILVLDEATASIDTLTEKAILQ